MSLDIYDECVADAIAVSATGFIAAGGEAITILSEGVVYSSLGASTWRPLTSDETNVLAPRRGMRIPLDRVLQPSRSVLSAAQIAAETNEAARSPAHATHAVIDDVATSLRRMARRSDALKAQSEVERIVCLSWSPVASAPVSPMRHAPSSCLLAAVSNQCRLTILQPPSTLSPVAAHLPFLEDGTTLLPDHVAAALAIQLEPTCVAWCPHVVTPVAAHVATPAAPRCTFSTVAVSLLAVGGATGVMLTALHSYAGRTADGTTLTLQPTYVLHAGRATPLHVAPNAASAFSATGVAVTAIEWCNVARHPTLTETVATMGGNVALARSCGDVILSTLTATVDVSSRSSATGDATGVPFVPAPQALDTTLTPLLRLETPSASPVSAMRWHAATGMLALAASTCVSLWLPALTPPVAPHTVTVKRSRDGEPVAPTLRYRLRCDPVTALAATGGQRGAVVHILNAHSHVVTTVMPVAQCGDGTPHVATGSVDGAVLAWDVNAVLRHVTVSATGGLDRTTLASLPPLARNVYTPRCTSRVRATTAFTPHDAIVALTPHSSCVRATGDGHVCATCIVWTSRERAHPWSRSNLRTPVAVAPRWLSLLPSHPPSSLLHVAPASWSQRDGALPVGVPPVALLYSHILPSIHAALLSAIGAVAETVATTLRATHVATGSESSGVDTALRALMALHLAPSLRCTLLSLGRAAATLTRQWLANDVYEAVMDGDGHAHRRRGGVAPSHSAHMLPHSCIALSSSSDGLRALEATAAAACATTTTALPADDDVIHEDVPIHTHGQPSDADCLAAAALLCCPRPFQVDAADGDDDTFAAAYTRAVACSSSKDLPLRTACETSLSMVTHAVLTRCSRRRDGETAADRLWRIAALRAVHQLLTDVLACCPPAPEKSKAKMTSSEAVAATRAEWEHPHGSSYAVTHVAVADVHANVVSPDTDLPPRWIWFAAALAQRVQAWMTAETAALRMAAFVSDLKPHATAATVQVTARTSAAICVHRSVVGDDEVTIHHPEPGAVTGPHATHPPSREASARLNQQAMVMRVAPDGVHTPIIALDNVARVASVTAWARSFLTAMRPTDAAVTTKWPSMVDAWGEALAGDIRASAAGSPRVSQPIRSMADTQMHPASLHTDLQALLKQVDAASTVLPMVRAYMVPPACALCAESVHVPVCTLVHASHLWHPAAWTMAPIVCAPPPRRVLSRATQLATGIAAGGHTVTCSRGHACLVDPTCMQLVAVLPEPVAV